MMHQQQQQHRHLIPSIQNQTNEAKISLLDYTTLMDFSESIAKQKEEESASVSSKSSDSIDNPTSIETKPFINAEEIIPDITQYISGNDLMSPCDNVDASLSSLLSPMEKSTIGCAKTQQKRARRGPMAI